MACSKELSKLFKGSKIGFVVLEGIGIDIGNWNRDVAFMYDHHVVYEFEI